MRLETERLILRPFAQDDLDVYARIAADTEVMRYFPKPLSRAEAEEKLHAIIERHRENGFHFLAAQEKASGAIAGSIGLGRVPEATRAAIPSHPEVEIGWLLDRPMWGKGLAPEGARACLAYAWDVLDLDEVVAFTTRANAPSRRVMEKIGMTRAVSDDFEHPAVPQGHPQRPHVLYRIRNPRRHA